VRRARFRDTGEHWVQTLKGTLHRAARELPAVYTEWLHKIERRADQAAAGVGEAAAAAAPAAAAGRADDLRFKVPAGDELFVLDGQHRARAAYTAFEGNAVGHFVVLSKHTPPELLYKFGGANALTQAAATETTQQRMPKAMRAMKVRRSKHCPARWPGMH
jgi:hypothetical protein